MKVIGVHMDRCTGCKTCELYCGAERGSRGKTLLKAVQERPAPYPRIRVEGEGGVAFPLQCRHCQQAPCIDACLAGALVRDQKSGLVIIREELCIGCWTCTAFCPYGVIYPNPDEGIAVKCDRCLYMELPVCLDVCPTKALELIEVSDEEILRQRRRKAVSELAKAASPGVQLIDLGR